MDTYEVMALNYGDYLFLEEKNKFFIYFFSIELFCKKETCVYYLLFRIHQDLVNLCIRLIILQYKYA